MRRYLLTVGALLLLLWVPQAVPAGGPGTYLATFMEVDGGSRQIGMGGAFTGLADDAMSVFYNPAGLKYVRGSEIHLETSSWSAGISYQHLAYGFRHSYLPGVFGLSWTVMQMNPYAELTEYYDSDSEFDIGDFDAVDAGDMAFGGSYCWDFGRLSVGGTLRWYHLGMAEAFCEGMMADVGVLYNSRFRNLRVGASLQNVGPDNHWSRIGVPGGDGDDFGMPTVYRVGASMRVYDVVTHRLTVAADYKYPADGQSRLNTGAEYTFNRGKLFVYGRAGYRIGYDEEGLTFGLGTRFPSSDEAEIRIDYAFINMDHLDDAQRIAVTFIF